MCGLIVRRTRRERPDTTFALTCHWTTPDDYRRARGNRGDAWPTRRAVDHIAVFGLERTGAADLMRFTT